MPVQAIRDNYVGERMDRQANFGDNVLVYVGWDNHLLFCSAKSFPLPLQMSFKDFKQNVITEGFSQHPDFEQINWSTVQWQLNGETIQPSDEKTLGELGFDHKSLLRFNTPELKGWNGTGV